MITICYHTLPAKRIFCFIGFMIVSVLVTTARGAMAETTLERIHRTGKVVIGFYNASPYSSITPEGEMVGESVEVLKLVFEGIANIENAHVLSEFASLIPGLKARRFDVIAAGMFVRPERCKQILFTEPTLATRIAFMVPEGNPHNLSTFEDIAANPDLSLGVVSGGTELKYAQQGGVSEEQIKIFLARSSGVAAVRTGRLDVMALTSIGLRHILAALGSNPGVEITASIMTVGGKDSAPHGAYGVRKEDSDLRDFINERLKVIIGSPEHLDILARHNLGKDDLPTKKTEELCNQ